MASEIKYFYLTDGLLGLNCLRDLIKKNYTPELVITHKNSENLFNENFKGFIDTKKFSLLIVNNLKELDIGLKNFHLGICVGFMEILKEEVFNAPLLGTFNLHCGKLPDYRGRAPISRALINGDDKITVTIHKMNAGVDSGDIFIEKNLPITDYDDANTLYTKCSEYSSELVLEVFEIIKKNNLILNPNTLNKLIKPQPKTTKLPYKSITKLERIINWKKSAKQIHNLIRALVPPYPSAITYFKKEELLITKAKIIESETENIFHGTIKNVTENGFTVLCGKGTIEIIEVIIEDKIIKNFLEIFKRGDVLK